jgi:hypothetical protein
MKYLPENIECVQVSNGDIKVFYTCLIGTNLNKIHIIRIETPTLYCIKDEDIDKVVTEIINTNLI